MCLYIYLKFIETCFISLYSQCLKKFPGCLESICNLQFWGNSEVFMYVESNLLLVIFYIFTNFLVGFIGSEMDVLYP